jgi:hypothetical protein
MDSSLLQLFTAQELLERLTTKTATGALHAFTSKESANIFFHEGTIVGAAKGLVEGEEVLRQVLEWKDTRFIWQPESQPAPSLAKPLHIDFAEFLWKLRAAPKLEVAGKILSSDPGPPPKAAVSEVAAKSGTEGKTSPPEAPVAPPRPAVVEAAPIFITIPSKAATTGKIDVSTPVEKRSSGASLTATKNINPTPQARITHEESLLQRFPIVLVSYDEPPQPRLKIVRVSSLVGRNPACDFTVDHGSISRQHCLLQLTDRGLHVKDLATTNGTKVNGITLTEGYVNLGDKLTIGNVMYVVEKDDELAAI